MDARTTVCSSCQQDIPFDGKIRKRNRTRKCANCNVQAAMKRRKEDPARLLSHRLNNSMRRLYPNASPTLWSLETIRYVINRFDNKSAIGGETNMELLCIFPYIKSDQAPGIDDLVLITSREAQSITRCKTQEDRAARFPANIQALFTPAATFL